MPRFFQNRKRNRGFSLVEALISSIVLALAAIIMSGLYTAGLQALDAQKNRMLIDRQLRSRMENILSYRYPYRLGGSAVVDIDSESYVLKWTITSVDLDGDATPEPINEVHQITVTLANRSLTVISTRPGALVGKI